MKERHKKVGGIWILIQGVPPGRKRRLLDARAQALSEQAVIAVHKSFSAEQSERTPLHGLNSLRLRAPAVRVFLLYVSVLLGALLRRLSFPLNFRRRASRFWRDHRRRLHLRLFR